MPETQQAPIDVSAEVSALAQVLAEEHARYESLVLLAEEQNRLMTGTDMDAIQRSARLMAAGLAETDKVRAERERLSAALLKASGQEGGRLSSWLATQPLATQERLSALVDRVRVVGTRLMQINEKNRRLASFCLDLIEEEAEVRNEVLRRDPAGRYDRAGLQAAGDGGKMVEKKA